MPVAEPFQVTNQQRAAVHLSVAREVPLRISENHLACADFDQRTAPRNRAAEVCVGVISSDKEDLCPEGDIPIALQRTNSHIASIVKANVKAAITKYLHTGRITCRIVVKPNRSPGVEAWPSIGDQRRMPSC